MPYAIRFHEGPREELRPLFAMADDSVDQVSRLLGEGRVLVAVAKDGGVAGHLQLLSTAVDEAEIASLAVLPGLRGRGIGRRLIEEALSVCRAEGVRRVGVATATADIGNLRFYQRLGFRAASVERDAYTPRSGYAEDLEADGIPVRDRIRFSMDLGRPAGPLAARGVFEAHLPVRDVSASVAFYRDLLGMRVAYELGERGAAFLWVGGHGDGMLGLWSIGSMPMAVVQHVALSLPLEGVLGAVDALRARGIAPLGFSGDPATEPDVIAWMPAAAVYLRDPDGHLLEYLAMLDDVARPALGVLPWSAWRAATAP